MRMRVAAFLLPALCAIAVYAILVRASSAPVSDRRIGVNLPDLSISGPVFADAMKQASPWKAPAALMEDLNGNIAYLRRGQVAETAIYRYAAYPGGQYVLLYDGEGEFSIAPGSGAVITRSPGRITLRIVPRRRYGLRIRLSAVNPADYPRNIRLLLPGYEASADDHPFYQPFVQALRQYHVVRFTNWTRANTYAVSTVWPIRTTPSRFTQAAAPGVALEYMIALANETADDPWFTIPVGATDYWVENFTAMLAAHLDRRLRPIIEYGDAVWKAGTPARQYAAMAARNVGLNGDPLAWYSKRSVRIFALVQQGLAPRAFVRVLSGPMPRGRDEVLDRRILENSNASRYADAFAVPAAEDSVSPAEYAKHIAHARKLARGAGLELMAYDGAAPDSLGRPRLDAWYAAGGGLFVTSDFTLSPGAYLAHNPGPPHLRPLNIPFVQPRSESIGLKRRSGRFVSPAPPPTPLATSAAQRSPP